MITALNEHLKIEHEETKRLAYAARAAKFKEKDFKKFLKS